MKSGRLTFLLLIVTFTITTLQAQPYSNGKWAYEAYPDIPFSLEAIDMELTLDPSVPLVKGTAEYSVRSRRPSITQVVFNTSDLDIRGITFGDEQADYRISTDSLIINLPDTLFMDQETSFQINWESSSPYGVHKDVFGNMWTSLNPQMQNHWLPIPDHPEVESRVEATFLIPADQEIIFNGERTSDEVLSTDQREVQWSVEKPIPVTGITFSMGNFMQQTARSGVKEVSLWKPENALLDEVSNGLLKAAVENMKRLENQLEFEFPYESLKIVVLPDHRWEEIQYAPGVVYLYQNLGSLNTQLKRGIAAQWFGSYHRYLKPLDYRYEVLRAFLSGSDPKEGLANNSSLESIEHWNRWVSQTKNGDDDFQKETITNSFPALIQEFEGVTSWDEYADYWYDETGIFWYDVQVQEKEGSSHDAELIYNVEYIYDEMASQLTLVFDAENRPVPNLVSFEATQYSFTDTTITELSFTGERDSVEVQISSGIEYLTLNVISDENITLKENKPFMFLVRQLTNPEADVQIQAAELLRNFTENPDVQLAIQDVLRNEENPAVRAALLETLATLTSGATGTEETFLNSLNSENLATRLSSIRSLSNYPENDRVKNAIRNAVLRAEQDTVFNTALDTYAELAGTEEVRVLAERFHQNEQYHRAIPALKIAIAEDSTRQSITMADRYALGEYPFEIREQALELLISYETNEAYWEQTLEMLLADRDARIRFQALNAVRHLSSKTTVELIRERLTEEMDPRVRQKIRRML